MHEPHTPCCRTAAHAFATLAAALATARTTAALSAAFAAAALSAAERPAIAEVIAALRAGLATARTATALTGAERPAIAEVIAALRAGLATARTATALTGGERPAIAEVIAALPAGLATTRTAAALTAAGLTGGETPEIADVVSHRVGESDAGQRHVRRATRSRRPVIAIPPGGGVHHDVGTERTDNLANRIEITDVEPHPVSDVIPHARRHRAWPQVGAQHDMPVDCRPRRDPPAQRSGRPGDQDSRHGDH
ncbi:hypothetical protein GCM10022255_064820 [Dactylosporangium darangshiense]|uniref:DUF222 domain-containing protein n=1 Tax=Dactylosporangium darangshiense TaxID=579108 RepID=A0ABP8DGR3_9ACTN